MNDFRIKEFVPRLDDIAEYLWSYPHEDGCSAEEVYAECVGLGRSQNIQCGYLFMSPSSVDLYAYRPDRKQFSWEYQSVIKEMKRIKHGKQLDLFSK